jgi:hypothetical protein
MGIPFWEQQALLLVTRACDGSEISSAHTGTLVELYVFWGHLSDEERLTANLRLHDRSLLEAEEIARLEARTDFPFLHL